MSTAILTLSVGGLAAFISGLVTFFFSTFLNNRKMNETIKTEVNTHRAVCMEKFKAGNARFQAQENLLAKISEKLDSLNEVTIRIDQKLEDKE